MFAAAPQTPLSSSAHPAADFAAFYAAHAERVLVFLARRTLDPEVAVDLVAETFAEAYASRSRYRGVTDAEAAGWVFAIARHQLSRWFRRGRAERRAVERLGVEVPGLEHDDHVRIQELAEIDQLRGAVRTGLDRLPRKQREALQLRVVGELSYTEVAELLGVSEQTARARVSRGLRELAGVLDAEGSKREEERHG